MDFRVIAYCGSIVMLGWASGRVESFPPEKLIEKNVKLSYASYVSNSFLHQPTALKV